MAVHITVFINKTQVVPAILDLKPFGRLVSAPLVSGSVPTASVRFSCMQQGLTRPWINNTIYDGGDVDGDKTSKSNTRTTLLLYRIRFSASYVKVVGKPLRKI